VLLGFSRLSEPVNPLPHHGVQNHPTRPSTRYRVRSPNTRKQPHSPRRAADHPPPTRHASERTRPLLRPYTPLWRASPASRPPRHLRPQRRRSGQPAPAHPRRSARASPPTSTPVRPATPPRRRRPGRRRSQRRSPGRARGTPDPDQRPPPSSPPNRSPPIHAPNRPILPHNHLHRSITVWRCNPSIDIRHRQHNRHGMTLHHMITYHRNARPLVTMIKRHIPTHETLCSKPHRVPNVRTPSKPPYLHQRHTLTDFHYAPRLLHNAGF